MRQFGALRRSRRCFNVGKASHNRRSASLAACALSALLIAGCHAHAPRSEIQQAQTKPVPKPSAHLMAKVDEPACLYTDAAAESRETPSLVQKAVATSSNAQSATTAITDDAAQRRERERDCFRDAEARVRKKLAQLQAAVRHTQRAVEQESASAGR
jgi:hypothetical protein